MDACNFLQDDNAISVVCGIKVFSLRPCLYLIVGSVLYCLY